MNPHSSYPALAEAEYILCREMGEEVARQKLESLIQSRTIEIVEDSFLLHTAATVKCGRAIALGDCFTIALAQKLKGTALFARPEEDLDREMRRKPFSVSIAFLQSERRSPKGKGVTAREELVTSKLASGSPRCGLMYGSDFPEETPQSRRTIIDRKARCFLAIESRPCKTSLMFGTLLDFLFAGDCEIV